MVPTRLSGWIEDTAAGFAPQLLTDVRLRTAFSDDTVVLDSGDVVRLIQRQPSPDKKPTIGSRMLYALKPTFTVDSPLLGRQVFAPYGVSVVCEAEKNRTKVKTALAIIALGLVTAGFVVGRSLR